MITASDRELFASRGISEEQVENQLERFKKGFPFLKLAGAASVDEGILRPTNAEKKEYQAAWNAFVKENHSIMKFVPASGAASRMFKDLLLFYKSDYSEPKTAPEKEFFANIHNFAFYDELNVLCLNKLDKTIETLIEEGNYKKVVEQLLFKEGLNYSELPKGLLTFHNYRRETRTPVEEHLIEGAQYAQMADGTVAIEFTVSPQHMELFKNKVKEHIPILSTRFGVSYQVSFTVQKPSTDTLAVTLENKPYRDKNGQLVFRPGGHGALIENLNELNTDLVFIKNIDNITTDVRKLETIRSKQLLGGVLVHYQARVFEYLKRLNAGEYTHDELLEIVHFLQRELWCRNPSIKHLEDSELALYLIKKLNRPIRVCGMVRNEGEPGGGPFLAYNEDGTISLQIVESSQINKEDRESMRMFEKGTHFNPVDLVCGLKDYKGEKFDLLAYVDENTGFISNKTEGGDEIKALELPGLWNGAMSDWITLFVEVSSDTFTPVKCVNDLLREEHQ